MLIVSADLANPKVKAVAEGALARGQSKVVISTTRIIITLLVLILLIVAID